MPTKVVMSWSGGKDAALALWRLQQDARYEVVGLLTTFTERYDHVHMHGVRRVLVEAQAEALGLRLHAVWVPPEAPNAVYERAMAAELGALAHSGVGAVAFGDLFLEDIRAYREGLLAQAGLTPLFPVWGADTARTAHAFFDAGFHATVVCVDPVRLHPSFLGRSYGAALLRDLPPTVDPCGEHGEFHSFVHGGPNFRFPLHTMLGVCAERQGFLYAQLLPLVDGAGLHA